jgi:predicted NUDIX family phosphoesterase/dephospho-CoA kinase
VPARRNRSEFLRVAEEVLRREARPMSVHEIYDLGARRGLFSDSLGGLTPKQTLKSKLSVHIRRLGNQSLFVRTAAGKYSLRSIVSPEQVYESKPFVPSSRVELVLTVPSEEVDKAVQHQGISKRYVRALRQLSQPSVDIQYIPRAEAENRDDRRQVLVYIMVVRRGQVLAYQRGVHNYTDAMLRGADCIGFGGHVNDDDRSLLMYDELGIFDAARRELSEELALPKEDLERLEDFSGLRVVGLLRDDSSDVGRRHVAVVMEYECSDSYEWLEPRRGERSINQLRWLEPTSADLRLQRFEYWSQLCLAAFFPQMVPPRPSLTFVHRSRFSQASVVALLGEIGSGKTEAAQALMFRTKGEIVRTGEIVADILGIPPIPETPRETFQRLAADLVMDEGGARAVGEAIAHAAGVIVAQSRLAIVDGIRRRASLEALRDALPGQMATVYVHAPPNVAFEWFASRERPHIEMSEFLAMRTAPVEREIPGLIGLADAVVYNWRGSSNFESTVRIISKEVLG